MAPLALRWLVFPTVALASDTFTQDCEMCGLLMWRMENVLAAKKSELQDYKETLEKRAEKGSKAQTKNWIRAEYPVQLVESLESYVERACEHDVYLGSTACRSDGMPKSTLRGAGAWPPWRV